MELLIIGAGGHGRVVAEVAQECGYDKIAFLDDKSPEAVGSVDDLETMTDRFQNAFVGIGNNALRSELLARLRAAGFHIPTLVHPTAYVSRTAQIGSGTVVESKAIVNANTAVGDGCIISVGAIVDHDVQIGECCHVNAGAIVKAGAAVSSYTKLEAGQVVLGYNSSGNGKN